MPWRGWPPGSVAADADAASAATDGLGYLPALLTALDVPLDSQMLVFSKTSVQAAHDLARSSAGDLLQRRRAVAHVPGAPGLEAIAGRPGARPGVLRADDGDAARRRSRRRGRACSCHHGPEHRRRAGHLRRLGDPGPDRRAAARRLAPSSPTTRAPFAERWGGWYVTARRGEQPRSRQRRGVESGRPVVAGPRVAPESAAA